MSTPLINGANLRKVFVKQLDLAARLVRLAGGEVKEERVNALNGVDLRIDQSRVVGLVGESGCGKSTLGRLVALLDHPSSGELFYKGKAVDKMSRAEFRKASLALQLIFQDPLSALNPRMRALDVVGEAPLAHGLVRRDAYQDYVEDVMLRCGLDPAVKYRYPHQFSGGQRQRLGIARALAVKPELIVCDEAVAALDVSIQAQIINLFRELRETQSPDLSVHQPRYRGGGVSVRYGGGDVPGEFRRTGGLRRTFRASAASLYAGAAARSAAIGRTGYRVRAYSGGDTLAAFAAQRLRIPYALPQGRSGLFAANAGVARGGARTSCRLSFDIEYFREKRCLRRLKNLFDWGYCYDMRGAGAHGLTTSLVLMSFRLLEK